MKTYKVLMGRRAAVEVTAESARHAVKYFNALGGHRADYVVEEDGKTRLAVYGADEGNGLGIFCSDVEGVHYRADENGVLVLTEAESARMRLAENSLNAPWSFGVALIATERQGHVTREGYTAKHDDKHKRGEIAEAAACYASQERIYEVGAGKRVGKDKPFAMRWPWAWKWWKPCPNDRVRELVKAGALIAAEIDRLMRIKIAKARKARKGGAK